MNTFSKNRSKVHCITRFIQWPVSQRDSADRYGVGARTIVDTCIPRRNTLRKHRASYTDTLSVSNNGDKLVHISTCSWCRTILKRVPSHVRGIGSSIPGRGVCIGGDTSGKSAWDDFIRCICLFFYLNWKIHDDKVGRSPPVLSVFNP